ncbi:DEAD/DEAH box helicase [Ilumatobacter nonamiensis]|uniref:DEAD/DEAH box helicase n=1 Tax=Ilumatobacter nonamiensis TaxID=467093 RepID=UPI0003467238|nr:DEAD/DEAH box helicase [Ilumatobacter nonamiensis]
MTVRPDRSDLIATLPFAPDRFQVDAFDALDAGRHVVVAAPTGSGKTVVAEYGIAADRIDGRRSFYTAPIKALSNQKYRDLVEIHGEDAVGLLTGDNSINGDAPIVVMTTEVLRNMIYAGRDLSALGTVVVDEVHFLQDTYRGPVWEEVIIHLPQHVRLIALSATVSNVAELADWIGTVRGPTESVVERQRPVELSNKYLVADRDENRLHLLEMFVGGGINRDALRLDESAARRRPRRDERRGRDRRGAPGGGRRLATPGRIETVELLDERGLLPAIFFIFSRAQCDEAAKTCLDAGIVLSSDAERAQVRAIVEERLAGLDPDDLDVLGYDRFVRQLEAGLAAHHAGMVPAMKEVVEACFIAGLVKVVFATETLAVGINMPARSVVIEKLTKFTGDHHEQLTPGQYTQLTGRAGRRGLDETGDAIVMWTPWVRFDEAAQLASSSSFHLRSVFRPTYNMAANLIRTHTAPEAHRLLNLSFAQFQADRDVVQIEARLERKRATLAEKLAEAESPYGDIDEYRNLRRSESDNRQARRQASAGQMRGAMAKLKPGAIIRVSKGEFRGPVAVVAIAHRRSGVRLTVITKSEEVMQIDGDDLVDLPEPVGSIKLPPNFGPQRKGYRRDVGKRLRTAKIGSDKRQQRNDRGADRQIRSDELDVARDPDLRRRVEAAGRAERLVQEIDRLQSRVSDKNQSLGQEFDRVLTLLDRYGYADVDAWELTSDGDMLAGIFHECDLLVAEMLRADLLHDLSSADLAAIVSCVVYEHRSPEPPPAPWFSSKDVRTRWNRLDALSADLRGQERSVGLGEHREPDPTFAAIAHAWVAGEGFAEIVDEEELTGGDFVRTMKQLIDLLRQVATVAPERSVREAASAAVDGARRGVVLDGSAPG